MANRDLTGIWTADDGGRYFVHQIGSAVWWAGFSGDHWQQNGLTFCNVFNGTFDGREVSGQWADVPRGGTMNFGTLSLAAEFNADGSPSKLLMISQSGGFSAATWNFADLALPSNLYLPLQAVFDKTHKNTYHWDLALESLGELLEIVKDSVVLFGNLNPGENVAEIPFINSFPHNWPRTYSAFRDMNHWWDADANQEDADMTCHVTVDTGYLPTDLYDGMTAAHQTEVKAKLPVLLHPEMIMFSGKDTPDPGEPSQLLPGWAQTGGNSVLVNGRPLNGDALITPAANAPAIAGIRPVTGAPVRVTGALVFDTNHGRPLEIHPVYAIDFINASDTEDISGVWGDCNGNTFYIHNVFGTIWMLITRPFRDRTFAVVFRGKLAGNTATGDWVAIPYGMANSFGNDLSLEIGQDALELSIGGDNPWASEDLRKLYDVPGHPCPVVSLIIHPVNEVFCDFPEVEGATVVYSVSLSPAVGTLNMTYLWKASGGVAGSDSGATFEVSNLPAAGTEVSISVQVTLDGSCVYEGTRTFTTLSQTGAQQLQQICLSIHRLRKDIEHVINQLVLPHESGESSRGRSIEEAHHEIQELSHSLAELKRTLKH